MKTNSKFKKIKAHKVNQENLCRKAIKLGVNLIASDTIFLSNDTKFGKNVTINIYVVIGEKSKLEMKLKFYLFFSHIEGAKIEKKLRLDLTQE